MMLAASHAGLLEWSLNALWLLLTLAAGFGAHRHRTSRSTLPRRTTALIALACASAILFPSLSVSDDLYAEQWAIEDNSLIAKKYDHLTGAVQAPQAAAMGALLANAMAPIRRTIRVLPADEVATPQRYISPSGERAPPPADATDCRPCVPRLPSCFCMHG